MSVRGEQAIVIGGSIAGLITARVLADHFEHVTIVERDELPDEAADRSGTPQARHVHNLLLRGLHIMERFFPGFQDDLVDAGAQWMNWGTETRVLSKDRWLQPIKTEFATLVASRALVEWALRKQIYADDRITITEKTQVLGLRTDDTNNRIIGVEVRTRGGSADTYEMTADFVVDASGRGSKAVKWLETLGYTVPAETTVDADVGYATRFYKKPQDKHIPWRVMYMPAKAPYKRGGAIFEIENDVWVASLGGFVGDHPPTDPAGWMDYCKNLPKPDMYEALQDAEPLPDDTGIYGYQRTKNYIRHFERMTAFPERFALVGDAVCAFNPIYGQGMTSAAMGAELLAEQLAKADSLDGLGATFQRELAAQCEPIWLMATGNDLEFPQTVGERPDWFTRQVQRYINVYLQAMIGDKPLTEQFYRVMNLMAAPASLLRPDLTLRVLGNWWRLRGTDDAPTTPIPAAVGDMGETTR